MPVSTSDALLSGIDLLVFRGPSPRSIVSTIEIVTGMPPEGIYLPGQGDEKRLAIFDHPFWAVIDAYPPDVCDISYKISLDGRKPRSYEHLGKRLAAAMDGALAWPDESTLSAIAVVVCHPDGIMERAIIEDCQPDGMTIVPVSD